MKKRSRRIFGIDLGTTRSVIAYVDDRGDPRTIPNRDGESLTPSAALFENGKVVVGKEALKANAILPDQVAMFAKREMGKRHFSRSIDGNQLPPEMIQSMILKRLREDAERHFGEPVDKAVVTVPAYFNEPKRRSTIDAAMLAGFDVMAVINEPTAAAIAYGLERHSQVLGPQKVMIYDLGGGTFDVSIVTVDCRSDRNGITVIATDGNARLGGVDWDECICGWLDDRFDETFGLRPSQSHQGAASLLREAEEIKHSLTARDRVTIRMLWETHVLTTEITRETFDGLTAHLLDRARFTMTKLLSDIAMDWKELDQVILVGGSTRMPQVGKMIESVSGIQPNWSVSTDEAVAFGAAIFAATLDPRSGSVLEEAKTDVVDVNAHSLGVLGVDRQTQMRCNHEMVASNTPLPASQTTRFETIRDDQPSVNVEVIEGGDPRGRHGTRIGQCILGDLPINLPAGTPVDVTFRYNRSGLIEVEAVLPSTGQSASTRINRDRDVDGSNLDVLKGLESSLGLMLGQ